MGKMARVNARVVLAAAGAFAVTPALAIPDGSGGGSLWSIIGLGSVFDLLFALVAALGVWAALRAGDWAYKRGTEAPKDTLIGRWAMCRERIEDTAISAALFHAARILAVAILFGLLLG